MHAPNNTFWSSASLSSPWICSVPSCQTENAEQRAVQIAASGRNTKRIICMHTISLTLPAFTPCRPRLPCDYSDTVHLVLEAPLAGPPVSETGWNSSVLIRLPEKHLSSAGSQKHPRALARQASSHAGGSQRKVPRDLVSMVTLMVRLKNCAFL